MKKDNLKKLIESLKLNYVNENINEVNFPDDGQRGEVEIIDFGRDITSEEAIKEMAEKGYRPATVRELLISWAHKWNGKDWVVALGSVWRRLGGGRFVPCLSWGGSGRGLGLYVFESRWDDYCRFAAVRKLSSNLEPLNLESRILALESFNKKLKEIIKI